MQHLTIEEQKTFYRAWVSYANMRIDSLQQISQKRDLTEKEIAEILRLEYLKRDAVTLLGEIDDMS